jgi:uncharacterized glyoxalase superfamily protein PhnB
VDRERRVHAGYGTVTPYLACSDARAEIAFLKAALGAEERHVMANPENGKVMHAEVKLGTSIVMLGDAMPESGCSKSPRDLGGSPASFYLYVPGRRVRAREGGGGQGHVRARRHVLGRSHGRVRVPGGLRLERGHARA